MRKRRKALLWTVIGLSILIAVVLISIQPPPRDNQPVYNGRTLEQWLDVGAHSPNCRVWGPRNDGKGPTPQQLREAEESVRAIGTNAIPFLLEWISYRASPRTKSFRAALHLVPLPYQVRDFLLFTVAGYKYEIRSDLAELGFGLLNTNALPALIDALESTNAYTRQSAAERLADYGASAAPALPALRQHLLDTEPGTHYVITNAVQRIQDAAASTNAPAQ